MAAPKHLDEVRPWSDRAQKLELVRAVRETADVMTFTFRSSETNWFRYAPGQFITLELPTPQGVLLRTYTLSSSPARPWLIAVTVKAQPDSVGTRWMFNHLKRGDQLRAFGPAGAFSFHHHPAEKYLFLSGGSGVTPMLSMARWAEDTGAEADIAFVTCARSPADLLARAELAAMASLSSLAFVVAAADEGWEGERGLLDIAMLRRLVPDVVQREVFCCGPAGFMAGVRAMLADAGFDSARYHEESFHPADEAVAELSDAAAPGMVRFTLAGLDVPADGQTILLLARDAGLNIPSGCTMGLCGTCKVRCLAGETEMHHQGGIQDEEIAAGYILACCTRPVGDVAIEA